jgi:transcriptional regulator PpsR
VLLLPGPGEQHTFGLVMVSEFFRRAGWDVAGGPWEAGADPIIMVRREWFDVVGFSLGSELHLDELAQCIRAVRKAAINPRIGIMVGGPIFSLHPEFVSRVGADGAASDGRKAPEMAERLSASRTGQLTGPAGESNNKKERNAGGKAVNGQMGRFESPERFFQHLDAHVAANLIAASADVALVMDEAGVIRDMAFGSEELLGHGYQQWLGKAWSHTVTIESRPKVEDLLREAGNGQKTRWRHINHPSADGADLPLSYAVVPMRPSGQAAGHTVAFGRDLRANVSLQQRLVSAQLSMERDYWRLRHVETRYRLLFQLASEAVLIIEAGSGKLEEANPAAHSCSVTGWHAPGWTAGRPPRAPLRMHPFTAVEQVRSSGRPEVLRPAWRTATDVTIAVSLFRQEGSTHFMIRMGTRPPAPRRRSPAASRCCCSVMESAPDAFVVTDPSGRILSVNHAFLDLVQLPSEEMVRNESLEKWLGRTGVDMNVLISNLRQSGAVRLFATTLRGEHGSTTQVEISAVAVTGGDLPCLGFTIRDVGAG